MVFAGIALLVATGLGALGAMANRPGDGGAAYIIGYSLGVPIVALLAMLFVWWLGSAKSGLITLLVVLGLSSCASLAQIGQNARENAELADVIQSAQEDAGISTEAQTFVGTDEEERCFRDQGIDRDDMLAAFTDTSTAGGDTQVRILDATLICAPRIVDDPTWLEGNRSAFSAGIGTSISSEEMRCYFNYAIDNTERPGMMLVAADLDFLENAFEACFTEETMASIRGDAGTGPQAYGDDPDFDLLYDRCVTGNENACDLLYSVSSFDSEYDLVSRDCAGRGLNGAEYCTPGMTDTDLDGLADQASPGWVDVVAKCRAGDMLACDFAFTAAPFASEHERLGETCGERTPILITTCRDRFGEIADE